MTWVRPSRGRVAGNPGSLCGRAIPATGRRRVRRRRCRSSRGAAASAGPDVPWSLGRARRAAQSERSVGPKKLSNLRAICRRITDHIVNAANCRQGRGQHDAVGRALLEVVL